MASFGIVSLCLSTQEPKCAAQECISIINFELNHNILQFMLPKYADVYGNIILQCDESSSWAHCGLCVVDRINIISNGGYYRPLSFKIINDHILMIYLSEFMNIFSSELVQVHIKESKQLSCAISPVKELINNIFYKDLLVQNILVIKICWFKIFT